MGNLESWVDLRSTEIIELKVSQFSQGIRSGSGKDLPGNTRGHMRFLLREYCTQRLEQVMGAAKGQSHRLH
jgi:hypothetical protein